MSFSLPCQATDLMHRRKANQGTEYSLNRHHILKAFQQRLWSYSVINDQEIYDLEIFEK